MNDLQKCQFELLKSFINVCEKHKLTYTSYIALMSLWEKDGVAVKQLGERLFLDSGTLTPLLKKMEIQGLITRERSKEDERTVFIYLTDQGKSLKEECRDIPASMFCLNLLDMDKAPELLKTLHEMMERLK